MRRVREWPRLIAAVVVLALMLVLIGVVVASASSGGGGSSTSSSSSSTSTPLLRAPKSDNAAALKTQAITITRLRATVAGQHAQIATLQQQIKRERALRSIRVHAKTKHHQKHHAKRR